MPFEGSPKFASAPSAPSAGVVFQAVSADATGFSTVRSCVRVLSARTVGTPADARRTQHLPILRSHQGIELSLVSPTGHAPQTVRTQISPNCRQDTDQ